MKKKFSLKDHLFNRTKVEYLAGLFSKADKNFRKEEFVEAVMKKLTKLELKERIVWIAQVLEDFLPKEKSKALVLIRKALPPPLDTRKTDDDFGDFIFAPLGEFVVRNALTKEHVRDAHKTLYEITKRFSMEDAMRPFLNTFSKETLLKYKKWVKDKNYHVRRLVSESTRPLLPWSRRITLTTKHTLPFLDVLYADKTRYVTRSVANHLNDIAKKEPQRVVDTLMRWKSQKKQKEAELIWMTKHALRTLIKQGNTDALTLLGYGGAPKVKVKQFSLKRDSEKISPGETLSFEVILRGTVDEKLLIDYCIDFVKANGGTKPKVFKLKAFSIKKGEEMTLTKNHTLLADATTFTLHRGLHTITLQINGRKVGKCEFSIV